MLLFIKHSSLALALLLLLGSSWVRAVDYTWTGGTSSVWSTSTNWNINGTPALGSAHNADRLLVTNGTGNGLIYNPGAGVTTSFGVGSTGGFARGLIIGTSGASGSLTVSSGTLVFGGTANPLMGNAVSGTLLVNGGTIDLSGNTATFQMGLNTPLANSVTITVSNGSMVSNVIDLAGSGVAGATTVNLDGGTLGTPRFTRTSTTNTTTVNFNGGVLQARAASTTFLAASTGLSAVVKAGGALIDTNGNNITIGAALIHDSALGATVDGGLTKSGTGTLTLTGTNTYTGATVVNAGTLTLSAGAPFNGNNGSVGTGALTVNTGAAATTTTAFAISGDTSNANNRVANVSGGTLTLAASEYVKTYNLTGGTINAPTAVNEYLRAPATGLFINSLASTTPSTIANKVDLTFGNLTVDTADGAEATDLSITGVISENQGAGTGAKTLTKTGSGVLGLSGTSTYTGGTTINGGTLSLNGGGGPGGTIRGSVTVNTGGTLRLAANDVTGFGVGTDRLSAIAINGGGTMHVTTTGGPGQNQTLSNVAITMTGGTISGVAGANIDLFNNGSSITTNASATTSTISIPTIGLRQDNSTFTVADGAAAVDLQVSSALIDSFGEGNNALIKAGAGLMALSGNSSYTGTTSVNAGTLRVEANNALGTAAAGTTVSSGASLVLNGVNYSTAEALSLNGSGISGSGALRNIGTSTYAGQITAATHASIHAGGGTLSLTGGVVKDGTTLTLTGGGRIDISGTGISGASASSDLVVDGTTVVISAASNYNGPTTVQNNGTLVANATVQSTHVTIASGSTLSGTGRVEAGANNFLYLNGALVVGDSTLGSPVASQLELATSGAGSTVMGLGSTLQLDLFSNVGDNTAIASAADRIRLFGTLDPTLGGTLLIGNPNALSGFAIGDQWRFFDWGTMGSITSNLAVDYSALALNESVMTGNFNRTTGVFSIVAIPEPGRAVLLMLGALGAVLRRRRVE